MPFVKHLTARGKSGEYLEAVSRAVHNALVAELHMTPEDDFQLIHQHEAGELVFNRNFRAALGRRLDRVRDHRRPGPWRAGEAPLLLRPWSGCLQEGPGVQPLDVFVMMTVMPPENFSFADGVTGTDVAAAEALGHSRESPQQPGDFTRRPRWPTPSPSCSGTVTAPHPADAAPGLRSQDPATLPYGGEFTGPEALR